MSTQITFTIPGEPASKARPRFDGRGSKTRTYTPAKTKAAEARITHEFRAAGGIYEPDPEVTFAVDIVFYNGTRQRRDVDNMIKLVLDGLNKVAWVDDTQVMEVSARKCFTAKADAHTEVTVKPLGVMDRLRVSCKGCGTEFATYESVKDKVKFCSAACRGTVRTKAREHICEHCETAFMAPGKRRFCSRECTTAHGKVTISCAVCDTPFEQYRSWVKQRPTCSPACSQVAAQRRRKERATTTFPGTCLVCGAGTTRKEYKRCNPCKLAGKSVAA